VELELIVVRTMKDTYIGTMSTDGELVRLDKATRVPDTVTQARDLALHYFGERAGRRLTAYAIPRTAVLELREEPLLVPLLESYAALSKIANKSIAGRITMRRLRKMLGGDV
jgi:hypothetical protein